MSPVNKPELPAGYDRDRRIMDGSGEDELVCMAEKDGHHCSLPRYHDGLHESVMWRTQGLMTEAIYKWSATE